MYEQVEKPKESKSGAVANSVVPKKSNEKQGFGFVNNRHEAVAQRSTQTLLDNQTTCQSIQKKEQKLPVNSNVLQGVFLQNKQDLFQWKDTEDGLIYEQIEAVFENQTKLRGQNGETFYILLDQKSGSWIRRPIDLMSMEECYGLAEGHLAYLRKNLPKFGEQNEYTWLRRITGGGSGTLTGKRDAEGIKKDMSDEEYQAILEISEGFYDTSAELDLEKPRSGYITLYRGFTIPKIEDGDTSMLISKMKDYSDVIPSSASWLPGPSIDMSNPGQTEDAVLVYLFIPPEHPIVIMSYPDNKNPEDDSKPKSLDLNQAEVLIGASTQKNVKYLDKNQLAAGNCRYRISVELEPMGETEVIKGVKDARKIAEESRVVKEMVDIDYGDLNETFGDIVAASITGDKVDQIFTDLEGRVLKLKIFDDGIFGCIFEVQ